MPQKELAIEDSPYSDSFDFKDDYTSNNELNL